MYDWDKSTALLAAQAPWWEPGTASGYHMLNYGHLIGEVIRRITGLRLGEFFAAHVAGPLDADFHIGLPTSEFQRVANMVVPPPPPTDPNSIIGQAIADPDSVSFKTWTNPSTPLEASWTEAWRRADIGAGNGHGNARAVARLQSAVACGGEVDGVRLLSPKTIDRIFEVQSDGIDLVIGVPFKFGIGYSLQPEGRVCAWGGAGGSCVMMDVDRRMTFAYVMNNDGAGRRVHRCGAGRVCERHRDSLSRALESIDPTWEQREGICDSGVSCANGGSVSLINLKDISPQSTIQ